MNTLLQPTTVLLSAEEIAGIVARLGREISLDYQGRHPVLVSLLKGGVVFLADLIRQITIPHHIEFLTSRPMAGVPSPGK